MTQQLKLTSCNRCKDAGYPLQMIGFVKTDKVKPDGKPVWKLLNEDLSEHVHKTAVSELRDIEDTKPPMRPPMVEGDKPQLTDEEIQTLKQFVSMLKLIKQ